MEDQKFLGVYREIAANAIQNWELYNKKPEEARSEARKIAENTSIDDLENGHVWGKGSITAAVRSLIRQMGVDVEPEAVVDDIYNDVDSSLVNISSSLGVIENINAMIIQALRDIHDQWCIDNAGKFFEAGRNKQYQHLPLELIGWEEAKSDFVFLAPILKKMGVDMDMESIQEQYENEKTVFLRNNGITKEENLREFVASGLYLEELSSTLDENSSARKNLERSVECLHNNGEVITDAKRTEKGAVIWAKEDGKVIKNEHGDKVPEEVLQTKAVLDAVMDQFQNKKRKIDYPKSNLRAIDDEMGIINQKQEK